MLRKVPSITTATTRCFHRLDRELDDILCCESYPAIFDLECVGPPLIDVPSED
ncbi:hypothetical protein RP20_CCG000671 [Aedes albopictus]|nr:hypothetical protein RP20_CCG000671 [Aedes albopictus]